MSDQPRYLHGNPTRGYTSDPGQAMRGEPTENSADPTQPGADAARQLAELEPEAIPPELIGQLSREAYERWRAEHQAELAHRAARSRSNQLRNLQTEALRLDVSCDREWRAIDAQLELVARKVSHARRQRRAA